MRATLLLIVALMSLLGFAMGGKPYIKPSKDRHNRYSQHHQYIILKDNKKKGGGYKEVHHYHRHHVQGKPYVIHKTIDVPVYENVYKTIHKPVHFPVIKKVPVYKYEHVPIKVKKQKGYGSPKKGYGSPKKGYGAPKGYDH